MLLSATTASKQPKDQFDFFPLTVDVEERMYAAGRIPGSFFRREGRPSTDAILTCRLIDRPLRPCFVDGLRNEVQVVVTVLSLNPADPYDVLAINAASTALVISEIPFMNPIGAVRVGYVDGQIVINPTNAERDVSDLDLVVVGNASTASGPTGHTQTITGFSSNDGLAYDQVRDILFVYDAGTNAVFVLPNATAVSGPHGQVPNKRFILDSTVSLSGFGISVDTTH